MLPPLLDLGSNHSRQQIGDRRRQPYTEDSRGVSGKVDCHSAFDKVGQNSVQRQVGIKAERKRNLLNFLVKIGEKIFRYLDDKSLRSEVVRKTAINPPENDLVFFLGESNTALSEIPLAIQKDTCKQRAVSVGEFAMFSHIHDGGHSDMSDLQLSNDAVGQNDFRLSSCALSIGLHTDGFEQ